MAAAAHPEPDAGAPNPALERAAARLHQAAETLHTRGQWHQLCSWAAHNPQLSAANLLLLQHSGQPAEPVAAAASWRAAERALRPDAAGIELLTRLPATSTEQTPRWHTATVYPASHTHPAGETTTPAAPARSAEQLRDHLAATADHRGTKPAVGAHTLPAQIRALAEPLADDHLARTDLPAGHKDWLASAAAHVLALRADPAHPHAPPAPPPASSGRAHAEHVRALAAQLVRTTHALAPPTGTVNPATARRVQHARTRTHHAHQRADYGHARTRALAQQRSARGQAAEHEQLAAALSAAAEYFHDQLTASPAARTYLQQRLGADLDDLPTGWRLGAAPRNWTALREHLRERGFSDTTLIRAGLVQHSSRGRLIDRFRERLTIGIHDAHGQLVGFTARTLEATGHGPKYLNSPTSELYDKRHALLGLAEQRSALNSGQRQPLLVEGPLDALALAARGPQHPWAPISTCGTSLTTSHLTQLRQTTSQPLTLGLDDDPAGNAATTRIARLLYADPDQPATHVLTGLNGHDPADALATGNTPTHTTDAASWLLHQLLDQHHALDHPDWVPHQVETLHAAAELLAPLPTSHAAPLAAHVATTLTNLPNDTITSHIITAHLDHQRPPTQHHTSATSPPPTPAKTTPSPTQPPRPGLRAPRP